MRPTPSVLRLATILGALLLAGAAPEPPQVRIVCLGDSVTKAVRAGVGPQQTFCAILQHELRAAGRNVEVINAGVGGNKTSDGLARFERDVLAKDPGYVVLMFGLNDSWIDDGRSASRLSVDDYRKNLRQMIDSLKSRGVQVVLMTPNPVIAPNHPPQRNVTLKPYVAAVRELAATEDVPLVDVYRQLSEMAIEGVDLNGLFTDAVHPNPEGQKLIAEMLAAQFETMLTGIQAAPDR